MSTANLLVEISGLQKMADGRMELGIDDLSLHAGEIVAIVGQTQSGKAVFLRLLTGQALPTTGSIRLVGLDPYQKRRLVGSEIGILFAENALYGQMTAHANLLFHCQMRGLPDSRVAQVLAQVGVSDHANVLAQHLSPGLARRLAFGRTILHTPCILLLDMPFMGCDAPTCALLSQLIRQLAQQGKAIIILATDASGLSNLCQVVYEANQAFLQRVEFHPAEERKELPFKIPARLDGQVTLVNPADILYISAESGRARLHTIEGQLPTQFTLVEIEERLSRRGFFRAHRSYLVNLQWVKAIIPYTRDSFTLVLDDVSKTEIPLSKNAAQELRELLGY